MSFFHLREDSIYALPILHYTMELAAQVKQAFDLLQPDCVAVELPETLQETFLHAASRLPDISIVQADHQFFVCEPCDAACEGLRCALEHSRGAYCIDLDVLDYPLYQEPLPDPYSIIHIGLKAYYESYQKTVRSRQKNTQDTQRELHMARRLKELCLQYNKILYIGGFYHVAAVLELVKKNRFEVHEHAKRDAVCLATLTEDSCRDCLAEYGWISSAYELWREHSADTLLDRQKLIYYLYKTAAEKYRENTGNPFLSFHLQNTMKFVRNYALVHKRLMPDLFEIISAAKGCVDHNYAYETWFLASHFPYRKNLDNLEELQLTAEQIWGNSKLMQFHLKQKRRKGLEFQKRKKDQSKSRFFPPSPFSICSYPPEDLIIESFGEFLKKKGSILLSEESMRSAPFISSMEDGIDARETIRHHYQKKIFVKIKGRPPGAVGSVVVVFNSDNEEYEKYPWKTTWHGEHNQESDMAFFATHMAHNIVGPGISRCEYGGFLMSYPPRRLNDIWNDADYAGCMTKAEVLLMAAIDYALKPLVVYVAETPPRNKMRTFASRFGKKIVFIPLKQISIFMRNKIRVFHVLDGHDKREIAGDYIF